jgi:hypothetical protein
MMSSRLLTRPGGATIPPDMSIYQRTEAGLKAWRSPRSGLPAQYRSILGLIQTETHSDAILAGLGHYTDKQILDWLAELETLGFIESVAVASNRTLASWWSILAEEQAA